MSKKNKINTKKVKKTKNSKKQDGGTDVVTASVGLVTSMVDLGMQMFKTAGGIMSMPSDLARASPPPPKEAQQQNTPPENLPEKELQNTPRR